MNGLELNGIEALIACVLGLLVGVWMFSSGRGDPVYTEMDRSAKGLGTYLSIVLIAFVLFGLALVATGGF
jgi:hypothetical protein